MRMGAAVDNAALHRDRRGGAQAGVFPLGRTSVGVHREPAVENTAAFTVCATENRRSDDDQLGHARELAAVGRLDRPAVPGGQCASAGVHRADRVFVAAIEMREVSTDDDPAAVRAERERTHGVIRGRCPRQQRSGGPVQRGQPSPGLSVHLGEIAANVDGRRRDGDSSHPPVDVRGHRRVQLPGGKTDTGQPAARLAVDVGEIAAEIQRAAVRRRLDPENCLAEPFVGAHRVIRGPGWWSSYTPCRSPRGRNRSVAQWPH